MGTTVWVDDEVRQRLRDVQHERRLPSANAVIRSLLAPPALDARTIFALHHDRMAGIFERRRLGDVVAFGSRARGDARPDSDLDLAARLQGRALDLLGAEAELVELLGIDVHIVEHGDPQLKDAIANGVPFE